MNVYHISLSQAEEETLKQMYQFASKRRLRQRAHMVLLSNQRYCQKEVAKIVGVSYPTTRRVLHGFAVYGLAGLYDLPKEKTTAKLSKAQQEKVDKWLSLGPRALGYNQSNWTARLMTHHIKKSLGIQLSGESVRRYIHRLGYCLIRPRHDNSHLVCEEEKKGNRRP